MLSSVSTWDDLKAAVYLEDYYLPGQDRPLDERSPLERFLYNQETYTREILEKPPEFSRKGALQVLKHSGASFLMTGYHLFQAAKYTAIAIGCIFHIAALYAKGLKRDDEKIEVIRGNLKEFGSEKLPIHLRLFIRSAISIIPIAGPYLGFFFDVASIVLASIHLPKRAPPKQVEGWEATF